MKKTTKITSILTTNCTIVEAEADLEIIREIFDHFPNLFLPVVRGLEFIGVILREDFTHHYLVDWDTDLRAGDIVSKEMVKLGPHNTIEQAKELFATKVFDMIPVVDLDNDLIGVLFRKDVEAAYEMATTTLGNGKNPFHRIF